jgi:hypothetical protein
MRVGASQGNRKDRSQDLLFAPASVNIAKPWRPGFQPTEIPQPQIHNELWRVPGDEASGRFPFRGVPTVAVAARGAARNQAMYGSVLRAGRLATDKWQLGYTRDLAPQPHGPYQGPGLAERGLWEVR